SAACDRSRLRAEGGFTGPTRVLGERGYCKITRDYLDGEEQVMSSAAFFRSVSGINCDMGERPSPVRALEPHIDFYTKLLGFALAKRDSASALLKRDGVQIELVLKPDHDPATSGSCYFDVSDVEGLRQEFIDAGAKPGRSAGVRRQEIS